ncbi:MAG: LPS-assembly protein LptD [Pseudomonadota bacterium]
MTQHVFRTPSRRSGGVLTWAWILSALMASPALFIASRALLIGSPALLIASPAVFAQDAEPTTDQAQHSNGDACQAIEFGEICETPGRKNPPPAHPLDWVPIDYVPRSEQDRRCENCKGRYEDPLAGTAELVLEEEPIEGSADSTELDAATVVLTGNVQVRQGYRELRGDRATFDRQTRKGTMSGNISVREPGILLRGNEADFDSVTGEAEVRDSQFILHEQHIRGDASAFRRDDQGLIYIQNGELSYCAPEESDWAIRADELTLNIEEGIGTAKGTKIALGGVPVVYLPWLRYPIDDRRRTGFLWPDVGTDSRGGLDLAIPVYFNLAPDYDLLYAPRFIQNRGTNHEARLGYLNQHLGLWELSGAYMAEDEEFASIFPDEDSDRWIGIVQHRGLFNERWRSRVDYSKASDEFYLRDLDSSSLATRRRTNLRQQATLDYLGNNLLVNMEVLQFQTLAEDLSNDYKKLPQITARYRGDAEPFRINPILLAQYSSFDTDDFRVTGDRIYAEGGLSFPMQWSYGFLNPTVKYKQLDYDLNDPQLGRSSPTVGVPQASLDGGLFFERQTGIAGNRYLQTLEPRVYYLYSEFEDQTGNPDFDSAELTFSYNQLFRETRFSGRDRIDDADQMAIGVTTRFISDEDGTEQFNANIGQIFYFQDREVRLRARDEPITESTSEWAAELNWLPNDRLSIRSNAIWDPYNGKVNSGYFSARYNWENGRLVNLGWSFRRPLGRSSANQQVTDQGHLSGYFPITNRWSLFASLNYSFEADRSVEDLVGVEYDTCCWMVRLLHLRYFDNRTGQTPDFNDPNLQREYQTQVQVVLKGMGGFGNRVSGLLQDMIRGFEDREF